jgi:hypothetical protein
MITSGHDYKTNPQNDAEIMDWLQKYEAYEWPAWVHEIFPALFIFHRKNKPKPRKGTHIGFDSNTGKKVFQNTKKTRHQNNYWVYAVVLRTPDDVGTIMRNFKHKGFGELAGVCFATDEEVEYVKDSYRYIYWKYKTFTELYNQRRVPADYEDEWLALCDRMESLFPSLATGQLKLL